MLSLFACQLTERGMICQKLGQCSVHFCLCCLYVTGRRKEEWKQRKNLLPFILYCIVNSAEFTNQANLFTSFRIGQMEISFRCLWKEKKKLIWLKIWTNCPTCSVNDSYGVALHKDLLQEHSNQFILVVFSLSLLYLKLYLCLQFQAKTKLERAILVQLMVHQFPKSFYLSWSHCLSTLPQTNFKEEKNVLSFSSCVGSCLNNVSLNTLILRHDFLSRLNNCDI